MMKILVMNNICKIGQKDLHLFGDIASNKKSDKLVSLRSHGNTTNWCRPDGAIQNYLISALDSVHAGSEGYEYRFPGKL